MNFLRLALPTLVIAAIFRATTAEAEPVQPPSIPMPMPVPPPSNGSVAPDAAPLEPVARSRSKSLRITVGIPPTASDLGSEADMVSTAGGDDDAAFSAKLANWTLGMK